MTVSVAAYISSPRGLRREGRGALRFWGRNLLLVNQVAKSEGHLAKHDCPKLRQPLELSARSYFEAFLMKRPNTIDSMKINPQDSLAPD